MSRKRFTIVGVAASCFTLLLVGRAVSQAADADAAGQAIAEQQEQPVRGTTRVYDIRDLLMQIRQYPARSALGPPTRIGERYPARPLEGRATTSPYDSDTPYTRG